MRRLALGMTLTLVISLSACVAPDQHQKVELDLQKVTTERDSCQQELADQRAKVAALTQQMQQGQSGQHATRAEVNNLRQHNEQLQRDNQQLHALIKKQASGTLERPQVPASPLPDNIDQALQQFARKFAQRVIYERDRGAISFANDQLFESGSDEVRADAHAALHEFAQIASRLPADYEAIIVGHTDETPIKKPETLAKHPSNWHLSVHRSIAVKDVLIKAGLPAKRMGVMGYGQYRPVSQDRTRNRRVEIFLTRQGPAQSLAPIKSGS
ncbi:MAG: OmpA family protein [Planctomycetota bacterium]